MPLDERIFSWNLNDWIARGCALDPDKIAIRYIADGDPDSRAGLASLSRIASARHPGGQSVPFARRVGGRRGALRAADGAAALRRDAGRGRRRASPAASTGCSSRAARPSWCARPTPKASSTLGPTPGYEIWENLQAIRAESRRAVRILTVPGPGGAVIPETDFDTLAARQPGDRLLFERKVEPDRHRRLCAFRRHHRIAQAGEAYASGLCLQVLGQCGRHGAHRRRCDLRRLSDVPHRRHFRARLFRHRARHVDRHPLAARRARQALHRQLLEVRGQVRDHALLRRADDAGAARQERAARREARHVARLRLHRLDRVPGRGRAADREA